MGAIDLPHRRAMAPMTGDRSPYIDLENDAQRSHRAIDEAARRAGRDPAEIERALITSLYDPPASWPNQLKRLNESYRFDTVLVTVQPGAAGIDASLV